MLAIMSSAVNWLLSVTVRINYETLIYICIRGVLLLTMLRMYKLCERVLLNCGHVVGVVCVFVLLYVEGHVLQPETLVKYIKTRQIKNL